MNVHSYFFSRKEKEAILFIAKDRWDRRLKLCLHADQNQRRGRVFSLLVILITERHFSHASRHQR
jgi:hypothetical protein